MLSKIKKSLAKRLAIVLTVVFVLAACSPRKEISSKEVERAVNLAYQDKPLCVDLPLVLDHSSSLTQLGQKEIRIQYRDVYGRQVNRVALKQMHHLEKQGFYQSMGTQRIKLENKISSYYRLWQLTPKGADIFNGTHKVCAGYFVFSSLSAPVSSTMVDGRHISHAVYHIKAKWDQWIISFLQIANLFPSELKLEKEEAMDFYLTEWGWNRFQRRIPN
ncbi:MAG: hypothetical protein WDW19_06020 [Neisseriaceae bacterium]